VGHVTEKPIGVLAEKMAEGAKFPDGGMAAGLAGLFATSLCRKSLSRLVSAHPDALSKSEADAYAWELEDAAAHFEKLLDKQKEALKALNQFAKGAAPESDPPLTEEEIYRQAVSVPAAIAASASRVLSVAAKLISAAPSELKSDLGVALHLLYAAFIGGKLKMNDHFAHAQALDSEFVAKTRRTFQDVEDAVSQLVGPGLESVWAAIEPKRIEAE